MNNVVDNLAMVGKLVDDNDFITLIMNGVGPAFESTVNSVQARDTLIYLDDFIGLLISAEIRLDEWNALLIYQIVMVLYTNRNNFSQHGKVIRSMHQPSKFVFFNS